MRPKLKSISSTSTREKILKASIRLIEREGLDRFSLRKLAEKIKMDPMAVYHYFSSKDELMLACLQSIFLNFGAKESSKVTGKKETKSADQAEKPMVVFLNLLTMLGSYRQKYLLYPNLCKYLLNHPEVTIAEIEEFNQFLILEINTFVSNNEEVRSIRDILVDYIHGFCLAEISIAKKNKKQRLEMEIKYQKSISLLIEKLLGS